MALIACDTSATLQETFQKLGDLDALAVPLGDRHVLVPASRARDILTQLREHGQFPRLVGRFLDEVIAEAEAAAAAAAAEAEEQDE